MIGKFISNITTFISIIITVTVAFIRQNFRKIAISFFAFLSAFLIISIILLPKTMIAKNYIDRYIISANLPITYTEIDIGYFGSKLKNVTYDNKLTFNDIKLSYNPIGLIMKRLKAEIDSKFTTVKITVTGDDIALDGKISLEVLMPLAKVEANGAVNLNAKYNIVSKKGDIKISSGNISFLHPLMTVKADTLDSVISIDNNNLTVSKFEATGANKVSASGKIMIMPQNFQASILEITGNANFSGLESNFTLSGNINSPKFALQ